jgi:SAM-dependent methyltransferase
VNPAHNELCGSPEWAEYLATDILPKVLAEGAGRVELGDTLIEIGPGFGMATDVLMRKVDRVTAVEIDPEYARALADRFAGSNVDVVEGDGTDLQFADDSFSAAASFTMLHHMPQASHQDALFSEVARVLMPGGVLIGSDSLDSPGFRAFHDGDTCNPIDPNTLGPRLETAGFAETRITVERTVGDDGEVDGTVLFVARTPVHDERSG